MQQRAKAVLADLPVSDVRVAVSIGREPGDRVVAVDDLDARQPDDAVELVKRAGHVGRTAFVVARGEGVAGVEANCHARVVDGGEHLRNLLELCADASAETGIVLDQQAGGARVGALEHMPQVLHDRRKPCLEPGPFVRTGVEDDAVDAEVVRGLQIARERALRALAQRRVVTRQVDEVDGVKVKGRVAVLRRRFLERCDPRLVQLGRTPETGRRGVDLDGLGAHRFGPFEREVQPAGRVDVGSNEWHSTESKAGPFWHAGMHMAIFVMGDLDLAVRGRTYREPEGPHSLVVRGRDLDSALQHLASRADCRALAVVGLPEKPPDMAALAGRRLMLVDGDSERLREYAESAIRAGIEVEWIRSARPPFERLASALLPVGAIVLAAGSGSRMPGSEKLLLQVDGKPMIRHAIESASEGGCHQVVVVYSSDDVRDAVDGGAELVLNTKHRGAHARVAPRGVAAGRGSGPVARRVDAAGGPGARAVGRADGTQRRCGRSPDPAGTSGAARHGSRARASR